jgi:hypothetical protein
MSFYSKQSTIHKPIERTTPNMNQRHQCTGPRMIQVRHSNCEDCNSSVSSPQIPAFLKLYCTATIISKADWKWRTRHLTSSSLLPTRHSRYLLPSPTTQYIDQSCEELIVTLLYNHSTHAVAFTKFRKVIIATHGPECSHITFKLVS